jgi:hypothetical protein
MLNIVPPFVLGATLFLKPDEKGPRFDGLGGVSAGTGPRLLIDYPEARRNEILDFMFLPNFGARSNNQSVF